MIDATPEQPVDISNHLAAQQCARQWRGFLHALAEELGATCAPADLRMLSRNAGLRFATSVTLHPCPTLDELQFAVSQQWQALDWGWTQVQQQTDHVEIRHYCSPLVAAFGNSASEWVSGFLEGAYQQWFEQQGADGLQVSQAHPMDSWGCVSFRLGRP